ncbi:MAG: alcohol dehydrogenase catalytic domain-containing protein [Chloroflexi bacterium]|nr:alcohol dehydrogenase catalytic domain-containing protein [Chloroflexota bacterium]
MWAFTIHAPLDARFEQAPTPKPAPQEALVRVHSAAICGTDLEIYQGNMVYFTSGAAHYPVIPGHEWSGEVVQVGSDVHSLHIGDRVVGECTIPCGQCVYCRRGWYNLCANRRETGILNMNGGFAEFVVMPSPFLHHIGELPYDEASMVETTAIAVYAVHQAQVTPGDRVAVLGTGPVGLQAVQAAKAYGARQVVAIGGRPSRRKLAEQYGADVALAADILDFTEQIRRLTDGQCFDAVIEATGNPAVTRKFPLLARPHGRIVMTGLFGGKIGELDLDWLVTSNVILQGSLGSPNVWDETINLMACGKIRSSDLITHRYPLAQAKQALQFMASRPPDLIKMLLTP